MISTYLHRSPLTLDSSFIVATVVCLPVVIRTLELNKVCSSISLLFLRSDRIPWCAKKSAPKIGCLTSAIINCHLNRRRNSGCSRPAVVSIDDRIVCCKQLKIHGREFSSYYLLWIYRYIRSSIYQVRHAILLISYCQAFISFGCSVDDRLDSRRQL